MKRVLIMLLLTALLSGAVSGAVCASGVTPTGNKTLQNKQLIALKDGEAYGFLGLAKFELSAVYRYGDEVEYSAFTKYYGNSESKLKLRSVEYYDEASGITLLGTDDKPATTEDAAAYRDRFALYEDVVYGSDKYDFSDFVGTVSSKYAASEYGDRLVGVAYSTWMYNFQNVFSASWETPLIGNYTSLGSPKTVKAHGELLYDAGVDFVFVDWSNNVNYDFYTKKDGAGNARRDFETIEAATTELFEGWSAMENSPKIAIFIGCPGEASAVTDGRLTKKADQVYREYLENEKYASIYQTYLGKPLLLVYLGTPSFVQGNPSRQWDDERFTVRFITGFIGQQTALYSPKTMLSKYGIWSWEERGAQSFSVLNNSVECMTVHSAWRCQGEEGSADYIEAGELDGGMTFLKTWARAKAVGPRIVICPTWNEYSKGEQPTRQINKDLEPSVSQGTFYYDILKEQIALFKNTKANEPVVTEPATTDAPATDTPNVQSEDMTDTSDSPVTAAPAGKPGINAGVLASVIIAGVVASGAAVTAVMLLKKKK